MGCFDDEKCGIGWEAVDRDIAALGVRHYRLIVPVLNKLSPNYL